MSKLKQFEQFTDPEIIARVLAGETALYEIIIRRYNPALFKTGRSYGFGHADTEDLMQETYVHAYTSLGKFENRATFKTWLIKIMLNQCYHKKQKLKTQYKLIDKEPLPENEKPMAPNFPPDDNKTLLNKELGRVLENALAQLPTDYRLVFSMRELNGLNTLETSEALNITESNVKVRLNRAKTMLRTEITKMYSPEEIYEFNLIYCDRIVTNVMHQIAELNTVPNQ